MKKIYITSSVILLGSLLGASGCARETALAEAPPVEVIIAQPVSEKVVDWDVYTGTVDAKDSVEVRPRVNGHIKDVLFTEGEEIPEGKQLFVIDSDPFEADLKRAKGELTTAEAKLKAAEDRIAIYKPLADKGTVSKDEVDQAFGDRGKAIGEIDSAKAKIRDAELNIGYCKISSPITGKVGEALITKGNLVNPTGPDSLLTRVVAVDPMYVNFNVNEGALRKYQEILRKDVETQGADGSKPKIPVELKLKGDARYSYKGIVDSVDNRVDPATGSIKVRARFENAKGTDGRRPLIPGFFARVRVSIAEPYAAILVADRAILSDQNLKYVLAVNKEKKNVVERVDIIASDRLQESGLRVITDGLKGGEWIIVEGVNRARPGVTVNPTEGKMPQRPAPK
jgi:RND family efflux transporter MFP subunit